MSPIRTLAVCLPAALLLVAGPASAGPKTGAAPAKKTKPAATKKTQKPAAKPDRQRPARAKPAEFKPAEFKGKLPLIKVAPKSQLVEGKLPFKLKQKGIAVKIGDLPILQRGQKAVLSAREAADKGVMLTSFDAYTQPLAINGQLAGIHLQTPSANSVWFTQPHFAIVTNPFTLQGDDLKVDCRGHFPKKTKVALLTEAPQGFGFPKFSTQNNDGSDGRVKFLVESTALPNIVAVLIVPMEQGNWRLDKCTVERDP